MIKINNSVIWTKHCSRFLLTFFVQAGYYGEGLIGIGFFVPAYLDVPQYKKCTGELQSGLGTLLCKPYEQPVDCPNDSWNQLYGENGVAAFTDCEGSFFKGCIKNFERLDFNDRSNYFNIVVLCN